MRALAGYFGHHTHEYRRAAEHVAATVFIWQKMIEVLDTECAVRTLSDLHAWLSEPPPKRPTKKVYPIDRTDRLNLLGGFLWHREQTEEEERPGSWNSEMVASFLEGTLRHAAHMLRRSRWLRHLTQSRLTWRTRNGSERTIAHNSRVTDFNAAMYDHLRVLTTELKRLVCENRPLRLKLSKASLDTEHLARVLKWL